MTHPNSQLDTCANSQRVGLLSQPVGASERAARAARQVGNWFKDQIGGWELNRGMVMSMIRCKASTVPWIEPPFARSITG